METQKSLESGKNKRGKKGREGDEGEGGKKSRREGMKTKERGAETFSGQKVSNSCLLIGIGTQIKELSGPCLEYNTLDQGLQCVFLEKPSG